MMTSPLLEQVYHVSSSLTLVLSLVGTGFALMGLLDAAKTSRVAQLVGNGARVIVAAGHVRAQGVLVAAQAILFVIAVVSWALPHPPATMPVDVVALLVARKVLRLGLTCLLALGTLLDWRDRRALDPYVRH